MPVVKRSASTTTPPVKRRASVVLPEVELPDDVSEASTDLRDLSILIHGERKIGKTTLFAQEPKTLFIEFDPPQRALSIHQVYCPDWAHYLAYQNLLLEDFKYKSICVDRADLMYVQCQLFVCNRLGIDHPQDLGYGKGWDAVRKEFQSAVSTIMGLAPTRWITHSALRETEDREGQKIDRLGPDLTKQADSVLTGLMDITAAYTYRGKERVLLVSGDETIIAGHRVDGRFQTPKGRHIREIPMGDNPADAYAALVKAFENKQVFTTLAERDGRGKDGVKKK